MRFEFDFYGYDDETTGLSIDIDKYDNVDITNFYGYGDFAFVENKIKTLQQLKEFIKSNIYKIDDSVNVTSIPNLDTVEELLYFIDKSLKDNVVKVFKSYIKKEAA